MLPLSNIPQALPMPNIARMQEALEAAAQRLPGVDGAAAVGKPTEILPGQAVGGDSFGSLLGKLVSEVNTRQNTAAEAASTLQSGGNISLHQAVIAMEEASVSFQLMVEVRNKLLESYQELMRMQI